MRLWQCGKVANERPAAAGAGHQNGRERSQRTEMARWPATASVFLCTTTTLPLYNDHTAISAVTIASRNNPENSGPSTGHCPGNPRHHIEGKSPHPEKDIRSCCGEIGGGPAALYGSERQSRFASSHVLGSKHACAPRP